jgi:hypothetical protein
MIDPTGRNDYRLDCDGNIYLLQTTKADTHTIYATNADGIDKSNSIEVNKYFLDNKTSVGDVKGVRSDGTIESSNIDIYKSFGGTEASSFFEFVSKNSDVEWSIVKTTQDGLDLDYVSTGHKTDNNVAQDFITSQISSQNDAIDNYNQLPIGNSVSKSDIQQADHSHHNNSIPSQGDVNAAQKLQAKFPNAIMHNYLAPTGKYTQFDQYTIPNLLPDVEIIAPRK